MSFYDEIKDYSIEDIELIIQTQQDLYSEEEMLELEKLLEEKRAALIKENERKKAIEEEKERKRREKSPLACPKCGGPNAHADDKCVFCNATLEKDLLYDHETFIGSKKKSQEKSYGLNYFLSFLIPLVGFIMGGIMAADKDEDTSTAGKTCIGIAIFSVVLAFIVSIIFGGIYAKIISNLFYPY